MRKWLKWILIGIGVLLALYALLYLLPNDRAPLGRRTKRLMRLVGIVLSVTGIAIFLRKGEIRVEEFLINWCGMMMLILPGVGLGILVWPENAILQWYLGGTLTLAMVYTLGEKSK